MKLVKALDLDSITKKMEEFQNTFNQNIEKVDYKQELEETIKRIGEIAR